jgi:hypothetical protein
MTGIEAILASLKVAGHRLEVAGNDVILHPAPGNPPLPEIVAELRRHKAELRWALATVYLDFETDAFLRLEQVGTRTYVEDQDTVPVCLSYAIGDGPVQVLRDLDYGPVPLPDDLLAALKAGYRVVAHNFQFDRSIWQRCLPDFPGWPDLPLDRWDCTAFRARLARLPASLEECAKAFGLQGKDAAGKRLLRTLIQRRRKGSNDPLTEEDAGRTRR